MSAVFNTTDNWSAYLELEFVAGLDKTRLMPIKRYGPLSVQRPFYPEQECCHVYLLHPPGGVVGGDRLELSLLGKPQSRSLVTTPGATKFYLSDAKRADLYQGITVKDEAVLEYLPQENIYFPGARVNASTVIEVDSDSVAMCWEKHCFGRPSVQERFNTGYVQTELSVTCDDELLFTEKQRIDAAELERSSGMRGYAVSGTFVIWGDGVVSELIKDLSAIELQQGYGAVTQPQSKLMLVRYLGHSTAELNHYFITVWKRIRHALTKSDAVCPRIWAT